MNKFNSAEEAIDWLKQGKILLHPTEGVWGIGCDAFNATAVNKIN
ncbi:MAG: Sua5/YciO/YrdC/YwlC family protein, partial [Gammaproteobacteria bacterium]